MKYIFVICKIYKSINIRNNKNGYETLERHFTKEYMRPLREDMPTVQGHTSGKYKFGINFTEEVCFTCF